MKKFEDYLNERLALAQEMTDYLNELYAEEKQAVINADTPEAREKALNRFEVMCYQIENYDKEIAALKNTSSARDEYSDCENLSNALHNMFESQDVEDLEDGIAVRTNVRRLSNFANMLKAMFKVEPADMFTFNSSFTSHNGKTEHGHRIVITCDNQGRGVVKFNLTPARPYWLPNKK